MAYGPDGERVSKSFNGTTTHYFGNDAELTFSSLFPAGQYTSYLHADIRREGALTDYLVKDHLSSNRLIVRHGLATTPLAYGPYGNPKTPALVNGKGYINERYDPETGLSYHHARYYDPLKGSFNTPDTWYPMLSGVDINRYAYAGGDPVNGSDGNGHRYARPSAQEQSRRAEADRQLRREDLIERTSRRLNAGFQDSLYNVINRPRNERILAGLPADLRIATGARALSRAQFMASGQVNSDDTVFALVPGGAGLRLIVGGARQTSRILGANNNPVGIGRYGNESIVARSSSRNFTPAERAEVRRIGSQTGCHTCGTKNPGTRSGNFVMDHQPSNALNVGSQVQRLYPQCQSCSNEQGLAIIKMLRSGDLP